MLLLPCPMCQSMSMTWLRGAGHAARMQLRPIRRSATAPMGWHQRASMHMDIGIVRNVHACLAYILTGSGRVVL
jgi:hypothetical protein